MRGHFPRPRVVISKCLGFDRCRYDGEMIAAPFVQKLKDCVDFYPICPEVEIGLGIPRKPVRIVTIDDKPHLYQPATGQDVTEPMQRFAKRFLDALPDVDGFLLKHRSPSCGPGDVKIYPGFEPGSRTLQGSGFFGGAILERFDKIPVEDEDRLRDFTIREHFLTRIFILARFREVKKKGTMKALVHFHSTQKLLLMGYNQTQMRRLGKIVANHEHEDFYDVTARYEAHLKQALTRPPRFTAMINALQHAFGGLSDLLLKDEKAFFLESLEEYRDERIPLSALLHVLQAWAIHQHNTYLLHQTFLQPYPSKLVEISDSGKGRNVRR